jgi:hypothetical protein
LPATLHGYSYVDNNPTNHTDPLGLCIDDPYDPYVDYTCWFVFNNLIRQYPEALVAFPGLASFSEEVLRGILRIYENPWPAPSPPRTEPIRIPLSDYWANLPLSGFEPVEVVLMPPGYTPQPWLRGLNPSGWETVATCLSAGGALIDLAEAATAILAIPAVPELLSIVDIGAALGSTLSAGETFIGKPHPDLPSMGVLGQDVLFTVGEAAFIAALEQVFVTTGYELGSIPGALTGYVVVKEIDGVTSFVSFAYDTSRVFKLTPNRVSIGLYMNESSGYPRIGLAFLLYE